MPSHGRWYLPQTIDGKQKWHPLTRIEAGEAALFEALSKLLGYTVKRPGNIGARLKEFRAVWLRKLEPAVRKEYERIYDDVAEAFADCDTEKVTPKLCQDYVERFGDTPTQARAFKARLSTFFRWCCIKGYAEANPVREVWLEAPEKRDIILTPAVFWQIHDAMAIGKDGKPTRTGPMAQCLMEVFYLIEQRTTDLRNLTLAQVGEDWISFKPSKTRKTSGAKVRWKITPAIRDVLARAAAIRAAYRPNAVQSFYVFPTPEGTPYSARRYLGIWNRALARCGLEEADYTPKDILPSSMTHAEEKGYTVEQLRQGRAHTTIETTEGYLKQKREIESPIELELPARPKQ